MSHDSNPRQAVPASLERAPRVTAAQGGVAPRGGVVTLAGHVEISNQGTLKPAVEAGDIGDDIVHAPGRRWVFDSNPIHVGADGGAIRLIGTARAPRDRRLAAATAWAARGTASVANDIAIL